MQTALLIFIVVFALAIGFFLGLFLLSLDAPFLKQLFQKDDSLEDAPDSSPAAAPGADQEALSPLKKPSPESRLLMQVWKEEGKPPVYEFKGVYVAKEKLPPELLHVITIHEQTTPAPEPQPEEEPEQQSVESTTDIEEEEHEIRMLSVVDEVNEILQHKLHGSPMAGKGIHLMENHNQEIRFWVGLQSYNDVSEIPDPEIQRLINESVREWEQSRE